MSEAGRWAGRNPAKDAVRHAVWARLVDSGAGRGPVWSEIPDFDGAEAAAAHLAAHPLWQAARTVKVNPDHAQTPVRRRALEEGRVVFTPVPHLTLEVPYLRLDPARLAAAGITPAEAAAPDGFMRHGERLGFHDVAPLDFCVMGSVAVSRAGGRTGKGAGFADLETGIFRSLGLVSDRTPMATTVHSLQLVPDARVPLEPHDAPLDLIATEAGLIETHHGLARAPGIDWARVRPDQFAAIPFLTALRDRMAAEAP